MADQSQTVFSVQMDRSGAYIAKPEHVEATIEKSEKKKMQCKTKLCIAAAVVALLIIVGLAVLAILPHLDEDSLDFATDRIEFLDTEDKPCLNPPTGLMKMTSGVKVLEVDTDPMNADVSGDGETSQILALTCNDGKKFVDQSEREWDLPDQVSFIENLYFGQSSASAFVFRSVEEFSKYRQVKVGVGLGKAWEAAEILLKLEGKASWMHYSEKIRRESKTIIRTSKLVGSYKVVFKSYEGLRFESSVLKSFQNLRDCTPTKDTSLFTNEERSDFEKCINAYKDFISFHGTHYYTQASLGGRIWSYYEVSSSYSADSEDTDLELKAEMSFLGNIGIKGSGSYESVNEEAVQEFESQSTHQVSYRGGKSEFYYPDKYEEWRNTTFSYPASFDHQLAPIFFLVSEKDPRRELMRLAFEEYIEEY